MRHVATLIAILFLAAACTSAMQDLGAPPPAEPTAAAEAVTTAAPAAAAEAAPSPSAGAATDEADASAGLLPTPTPAAAQAAASADAATEVMTPTAAAAVVPDLNAVAVRLEPVVADLEGPLFVTHAGDGSGRLFVLEKVGRVRILQEGQLLATPFLDITGRVSLASEQGLLGLAFAPDYAQSGEFFINYTDLNGDTVISRWVVSADPNVADAGSERVLLQLDQPAPNHNGGMLAFGPDGYLWIGTGDGGAANDRFGNGQNPATLLGKMLRLDVTSDGEDPYVIPADNPWVAADWNGQDVSDEIWAVGLRNPWRYSFDRQTGDLWIADVGQNWIEEINVVPAAQVQTGGLNFGWPIMEGSSCFGADACEQTGLVLPIADYTHEGHCSVTGGYVYRGQAHPAWNGVYFYGDYCSGQLWALAPSGSDGSGGWNTVELARNAITISSFGEDEAGELYVTNLAGGDVYRLTE